MNANDLSNPLEYIAKQQYKNWIEFYTKNTFKSFENNFKDESEFNKFLNNFNDENEKFKFIFCGNYYHYLKFNEGLNANTQLIMILAIVEKIYSKDDFIDFKDWCSKNQSEINIKVDYMTMAQEYFKRAIFVVATFSVIVFVNYIFSYKLLLKDFLKVFESIKNIQALLIIMLIVLIIQLILIGFLLKKIKNS